MKIKVAWLLSKTKWKGPLLVVERIARLKLPSDPLFNGSEVIHDKECWKPSAGGAS
jgi:hypothetical protein